MSTAICKNCRRWLPEPSSDAIAFCGLSMEKTLAGHSCAAFENRPRYRDALVVKLPRMMSDEEKLAEVRRLAMCDIDSIHCSKSNSDAHRDGAKTVIARVIEWLAERPPSTRKQIHEGIGGSLATLSTVLCLGLRRGLLINDGHRKYRVTEEGRKLLGSVKCSESVS